MNKSLRAAVLAGAVVLSFGFSSASAQDSVSASEAENTNLWFVELWGAPTADGASLSAVRAEKDAFRKAAAAAGVKYTERRSFDSLFNGLSVEVDAANRVKLLRLDAVQALWPVTRIQAPPDEIFRSGAAADLATAIAMTGADIAQNSLGLTGAGVKVAVMDTGIDYHHPDLGGCFGPGCRVAFGYDLVGDAYNADPASPSYNPIPSPDPDPDDCNGHGTHVSGIVGANGVVKGVAPGVTFGAYRVFGCAGSTDSDIMIEAMERALADGMQVLNMSIGSAFDAWPNSPTAKASDRLVSKKVTVVASIGNSGASGLYSAGSPGVGKKVIGVASFDNTHVSLLTFTISPDNAAIGYGQAAASPTAPTSGTQSMARTGTVSSTADACSALPAGSLAGKVALIRRGTCTFNAKSFNAQNAGAVGVVLYNNAVGRFSATVAGPPTITIPVVSISDTEGALIDGRLAAGPVDMTWTSAQGSFVNPTGGLISSFSSFGLAADLSLKPDIGAPGGLIYSTYPLEQGGYATISGTSMSSPHTAGAVALLLQAYPKEMEPGKARSVLQNSADPKNWFGNPGLGFLDNVHRQGAGMLDIDDAILAKTRIEPGKIEAGEGAAGPFTQRLTIVNRSKSAVTYDLSSVNALSTGGVITPSFFLSNASVAFSAPSVTVPAKGTATVNATISPATGPANGQYGGYIVFTPQGGGQTYRVPFAGFVGDYQGIVVLQPTANGFPWLAKLSGGFLFNQPAGASYSLVGDDIPFFLVHLDHQARRVRFEVFDAVTGKAWHRISDDQYTTRNSTPTSFFAFTWDGVTFKGKGNKPKDFFTVPNGSYVVKLSVLKALGDDTNPAHWETWNSPVVTLARP